MDKEVKVNRNTLVAYDLNYSRDFSKCKRTFYNQLRKLLERDNSIIRPNKSVLLMDKRDLNKVKALLGSYSEMLQYIIVEGVEASVFGSGFNKNLSDISKKKAKV